MKPGIIDPRYGDPTANAPAWEDIERLLTHAQLYWIITVRATGHPHAVPLVGVWHDGAFAFCTGAAEQKHRNLDANQHVAITTGSTGTHGWNTGTDIVVEGTAQRITNPHTLQELADAWHTKYGQDWRFAVRDDQFIEHSNTGGATQAGAHVYRVTPAKVLVFGDNHGQTRYRP